MSDHSSPSIAMNGSISAALHEAREKEDVQPSRRRFLGAMMGAGAVLAAPSVLAGEVRPFSPQSASQAASSFANPYGAQQAASDFWNRPRVLHLKRYQTNESIHLAYWKDGFIDDAGYRKVCWLMRDVRAGVAANIDPRVLDLLCAMQAWVGHYGFKKPFLISSGYRTQSTNSNLEGAAKNSMHLHGKAVDLIFPDLPVSYVGQLAQHYSAGGVGFYPSRGFVHVDTGRIRSWGRK